MALRSFGALLLFTTSSCIPSIKSVFVDLSYPADPTPSAARDVVRSLDAVVTPTLLNGNEQPSEAGACLGELSSGADIAAALWSFGRCRAEGQTELACLPMLPWIKPVKPPASPSCPAFS